MHDAAYYKKLGFKCGLEIHQRLATKEKLFCSCNAGIFGDKKVDQIVRTQRAVAGELGATDVAARFESGRGRVFVYNTFRNTTCLVDVDEEPPHELNREALETALLVTASFNASAPEEVEPMRKEVVDGSNPTAFQRTMLVGYDGSLELGGKEIGIPFIYLEEESSGIEGTSESRVTYNTERVGVPLVEVDTDPVLSTPEEAQEAALKIGLVLRLTNRVQRGIGTIRQDVNVSIRDGARVEIKGFQELEMMDVVIENEVERQLKLLEIGEELRKRKAKVGKVVDLTELFKATEARVIRENLKDEGVVLGARLEGFGKLVGKEINPNRRLGSELSDYAKVAGVKGIIHSDEELGSYSISKEETAEVEKKLRMKGNDAFIIIAGPGARARLAMERALWRAEHALRGVPVETRVVDSKLSITRFLRPLPGGARMYPETDARPVEVNLSEYESIKQRVPRIEESRKRLEMELGNRQLSEQMLKSAQLQTYNMIVSEAGTTPMVVASFLLEKMKDMRRSGVEVDRISKELLVYIFSKYTKKEITKVGIEEVLRALPTSERGVEEIIEKRNLKRISGERLKELVKGFRGTDKKKLMGEIMSRYRTNVDGDELSSILK